MAAAQTKGHEENKLTGMQGKSKKRKNRKTKGRKQGTKSKQESRTQGVSTATNLLFVVLRNMTEMIHFL